jgi:UDP-glucose 4-epimerase
MKYLVTGGAGFIGGHLIKRLINEGNEVTSIDNYCTGKILNHQKGCNYINFDIRTSDFTSLKGDYDYIFHLAYPYGADGMGLDQAYLDTGLVGTYNVLKYAVKNNIKKVINISSVSAYGIIKSKNRITEEMKGKHYLHYGVTKKSSEQYCKIFKDTYGLDTVSLRLFYAYGERYATLDHSALVNFLDRARKGKNLLIYGDGLQLRDYTYISDIVEGIIQSVNSKGGGEIYNLSGGGTCNILELAETILKITKSKINIEFTPQSNYRWSDNYVKIPLGLTAKNKEGNWYDERNYIADNTKAKKDFNYNPVITLEEGIQKTWEWLNQ